MRGLERGLERAFKAMWQHNHPSTDKRERGGACEDQNHGSISVAAYMEIEAFICYNLVKQMEQGILAPAPVWTDLKTFPSQQFHNKIHGIVGGYPCQPFSNAGQRAGTEDPRHLFPHICKIIDAVKPVWCFFENVGGHLTLGYDEVYRSLRDLGYTVEAGLYTAEECGAPHERERLFILAIKQERGVDQEVNSSGGWAGGLQNPFSKGQGYGFAGAGGVLSRKSCWSRPKVYSNNAGSGAPGYEINTERPPAEQRREEQPLCGASGPSEELANAERVGSEREHRELRSQETETETETQQRQRSRNKPEYGSKDVPNQGATNENERELANTRCTRNEARVSEQGQWQEGHTEIINNNSCENRWPAPPNQEQYEWEEPRLEPGVGFTAHGYNFREDLLRLAGNGVVEDTAELAFLDLLFNKHLKKFKEVV